MLGASDEAAAAAPARPPVRAIDTGRAVLHFFALGFVLLVGTRAVERAIAPRRALTVVVPSGLGQAEREARVDEAILIEEGIALGWPRTDPVIRARLISNLRFARGEREDAAPDGSDGDAATRSPHDAPALLDEAIRLDMPRTDLIVRRRLLGRAERMLAADVGREPVDDATLLRFRDAHPARFRAPARFRYAEVFVSRQAHLDDFDRVVAEMGRRLVDDRRTPADARSMSEPLLYSPGDRLVSADEITRRLGGSLASQLAGSPVGTWSGPYASSYGAHFVWVLERRESELPSLEVARARILGAYRDATRQRVLRARMAELRARYLVRVVVREGAP